ncbi:hypothetical protein D3C75_935670 [compost metagenome]
MTGIAHGIVEDVGDHRADQFAIKEAQRTGRFDPPAGEDIAVLQQVLLGCQLRLDEVVQFVIIRTHRQLIDAQFVQPQQLHEHAIEMGDFVLQHPLLATATQILRETCQPLAMGLGKRRQGVFHVMYGGGDHRGEIQPLIVLVHAPKARICSLR